MGAHRLYRFDKSGHIKASDVVQAHSETAAINLASDLLVGSSGERWLEDDFGARKRLHHDS